MGQYYLICNLDKRQFLHPHKLGDGLKLLEFGVSGCGTLTALAVLLADSNGRGGGDLNTTPGARWPGDSDASQAEHPLAGLVGAWAGDRIVIAGDYADAGQWPGEARNPRFDPELPATHFHEENCAYNEACFDIFRTAMDHGWLDISYAIRRLLCGCDGFVREQMSGAWTEDDAAEIEAAVRQAMDWLARQPEGWTKGQKDHYRQHGPGQDLMPRIAAKKRATKKSGRMSTATRTSSKEIE